MIRFIFRRILETIPVLWAVATITFFMLRLAPGGPFDDERQVSPEVLRTLQAHYGLDKPLMAQYGVYLLNLLKGDLGPSFKYPGRSVNELISAGLPTASKCYWTATHRVKGKETDCATTCCTPRRITVAAVTETRRCGWMQQQMSTSMNR